MGNDVDEEMVDAAASFLFCLFLHDPVMSRNSDEKIRNALGPFPASAASHAYNAVQKILTIAPACETGLPKPKQEKPTKEFGNNIKFCFSEQDVTGRKEENKLSKVGGGYDSLSDEEEQDSSQLLTGIMGTSQPCKPDTSSPGAASAAVISKPLAASKYSGEWLKSECQACVSGKDLEWWDVFGAVFEQLSSVGEDSAIGNFVSCTYTLGCCH